MSRDPIFVVGTPRSGTTLTARILGNHPAIFMPGETHFMEDIFARRRQLGDPADRIAHERVVERLRTLYGRFYERRDQHRIEALFARSEFVEALDSAHSYRDLLDTFMRWQMTVEGRRRWGNQVPRDLFELDRLFEFYPDARVVACIRDPRDFLLSYRDRWKIDVPAEHEERLRKLYHPVLTSILWRTSMAALDAALKRYDSSILVSRYSKLVTEPERQVKAICAFVGEEFFPAMLDVGSYASSAGTEERKIFASSVGRWRNHLPPSDAAVAQRVCSRYMPKFGYLTEPVRANPLTVAGHVLGTPFAAWQAIAVNARVRGPLLPYLAKRLGKLIGR
jgi:hypothetical protein